MRAHASAHDRGLRNACEAVYFAARSKDVDALPGPRVPGAKGAVVGTTEDEGAARGDQHRLQQEIPNE